jgi:hypothetical protein
LGSILSKGKRGEGEGGERDKEEFTHGFSFGAKGLGKMFRSKEKCTSERRFTVQSSQFRAWKAAAN